MTTSICCLRFSGYRSSFFCSSVLQNALNSEVSMRMISLDSLLTIVFFILSQRQGTVILPLYSVDNTQPHTVHTVMNSKSWLLKSEPQHLFFYQNWFFPFLFFLIVIISSNFYFSNNFLMGKNIFMYLQTVERKYQPCTQKIKNENVSIWNGILKKDLLIFFSHTNKWTGVVKQLV